MLVAFFFCNKFLSVKALLSGTQKDYVFFELLKVFFDRMKLLRNFFWNRKP